MFYVIGVSHTGPFWNEEENGYMLTAQEGTHYPSLFAAQIAWAGVERVFLFCVELNQLWEIL